MTGKYAWKYNLPADAGKVGQELEAIYEEYNKVTPELVVADARQPVRETHKLIEWDDERAAQGYRHDQAKLILRNIILVTKDDAAPKEEEKVIKLRVYINAETEEDGRHYMPLHTAMQREDTRAYVLKKALDELSAFRVKYRNMKELAKVFAAVDEVERTYTNVVQAA